MNSADVPTNVVVPANVYVHCPLIQFKLRAVVECEACEHFHGLADRAPNIPDFGARFLVLCTGDPTKRQIHEVVTGRLD